ncbi:MAG: hypothetical protein UV28_C0008G0004 [Candidatus Collierbacteria bacterium GW2011_GWE2_42_48]|nr:MAG: hypothetical protein UV28_C0008G0004 [Candidatus Collierbacteria bacterium GW2011_GWE2_42_48]
MKVYLDIDDTLINTDIYNTRPANYLKGFLEYILENHDVYWLTTHCNGDATVPVAYLARFVTSDIVQLIMKIKPTKWRVLKTEAIDMASDFVWLDDTLSWGEEETLKSNNKLDSHITIDLDKNPDVLKDLIKRL